MYLNAEWNQSILKRFQKVTAFPRKLNLIIFHWEPWQDTAAPQSVSCDWGAQSICLFLKVFYEASIAWLSWLLYSLFDLRAFLAVKNRFVYILLKWLILWSYGCRYSHAWESGQISASGLPWHVLSDLVDFLIISCAWVLLLGSARVGRPLWRACGRLWATKGSKVRPH